MKIKITSETKCLFYIILKSSSVPHVGDNHFQSKKFCNFKKLLLSALKGRMQAQPLRAIKTYQLQLTVSNYQTKTDVSHQWWKKTKFLQLFQSQREYSRSYVGEISINILKLMFFKSTCFFKEELEWGTLIRALNYTFSLLLNGNIRCSPISKSRINYYK